MCFVAFYWWSIQRLVFVFCLFSINNTWAFIKMYSEYIHNIQKILKILCCSFFLQNCWLSSIVCVGFFVPLKHIHPFGLVTIPIKTCKFWPSIDIDGHWIVRILSLPHLLWHGLSFLFFHPVTLALVVDHLAVEFSHPGFKYQTFRMQIEHSNWSLHL